MAGAPMRTPPGVMAETSPTTAFLFKVMWHRSQHLSILLPVIFCNIFSMPVKTNSAVRRQECLLVIKAEKACKHKLSLWQ